jgi:methylglutaconyl-CoA hydratase
MTYIKTHIKGQIGYILLDRPDKHNAFNATFIKELHEAVDSLNAISTLRALIIKSTGKNFSAGADMNWMRSMASYSEAENYEDAMLLARMFYTLYRSPLPTIAIASGWALGGGVGLLCCSDIILADTNTQLCFSETKLGLAAASISPFVVNKIGADKAKRYIMSAETFDANTAQSLGLVDEIHEHDQLEARANDIALHIACNGPVAVARSKALAQSYQNITEDTLISTAKLIAELRVSEEGQEGLSAFLEKRAPNWKH